MQREFFISCEIWGSAHDVSKIIKEICDKIDEKNFTISEFSSGIDNVGIIVNCFPADMVKAGWAKPRKYISYVKRYADIRLPLPYDEFCVSDYNKRFLMVVKNIVDSLNIIEEKCSKSKRANFNSNGITDKFLNKLGIDKSDIQNIVGVETI